MRIFSKKKYRWCVAFVFLAIACAGAQDAVSGKDSAQGAVNEADILLDQEQVSATPIANASGSSSVWVLARIVLVLALVCAGIYGVVFFLKKATKANAGNDPYLKSVATLALSPNKSVQVITLGERGFVVGVTDQSVSLIAEVSDRELVDAMNLNADRKNPVPTGAFQAVLANFFPGKKAPSANSEQESPFSQGGNFLRAQRERLQRGGDSDSGAGSEE